MIRICLSESEVEQLDDLLQTTTDAKLRHRVQIVLMAHRGRRHPDIAAGTGTSHRSVTRGLNAYLDGGLDRLRPRKAKGPRPSSPPTVVRAKPSNQRALLMRSLRGEAEARGSHELAARGLYGLLGVLDDQTSAESVLGIEG